MLCETLWFKVDSKKTLHEFIETYKISINLLKATKLFFTTCFYYYIFKV